MAKTNATEDTLNLAEALAKAPAVPAESAIPSEVLARLAALESQLAEQKAENERLVAEADATGGQRYRPGEKAFAGVEGYQFKVTPKPKDNEYTHLKPAVVQAVDESEALRWYCVANESKPGTGQAVDPLKCRLLVEAVGRLRADSIMRQKQIAALRRKVEAGLELSETESKLLATCEKEIFNY